MCVPLRRHLSRIARRRRATRGRGLRVGRWQTGAMTRQLAITHLRVKKWTTVQSRMGHLVEVEAAGLSDTAI